MPLCLPYSLYRYSFYHLLKLKFQSLREERVLIACCYYTLAFLEDSDPRLEMREGNPPERLFAPMLRDSMSGAFSSSSFLPADRELYFGKAAELLFFRRLLELLGCNEVSDWPWEVISYCVFEFLAIPSFSELLLALMNCYADFFVWIYWGGGGILKTP